MSGAVRYIRSWGLHLDLSVISHVCDSHLSTQGLATDGYELTGGCYLGRDTFKMDDERRASRTFTTYDGS